MNAKASGRLRHRFWGDYSAVIALDFGNEENAKACLPLLGDGWKPGEKHPSALVWVGDSEALEKCKEVLGSFGADVKKIDSIAKSIDYGEPFEVSIPMPMDQSKQTSLF